MVPTVCTGKRKDAERHVGLAREPVPSVNTYTDAGSCWAVCLGREAGQQRTLPAQQSQLLGGPGRSPESPIRAGWSHVGHLDIMGHGSKSWLSNLEKPRYLQAAFSSQATKLAQGHQPAGKGEMLHRCKVRNKALPSSLGT